MSAEPKPTPIDTKYGGRYFRSRLEARWAVFFDAIDIPWIYEPEGFRFANNVCYLPDFYLPGLACFLEIKPSKPSVEEIEKCRWLADATKKNVFLFFGNVGYREYPSGQERGAAPDYSDSALAFIWTDGHGTHEDDSYAWCLCLKCRKFGIQYEGRADRICRHSTDDRGHNPDHPRLIQAYDAANSWRFEAR